jgi:hypothetical protein
MAAWVGIGFNLLVFSTVLLLPIPFKTHWTIIIHFRPDFALPVLAIGICLGALGIIKIMKSKSK